MPRLIDANALKEQMAANFQQALWHGCDDSAYPVVEETIDDAPTVDAVEVVHGRCDYCKDGKSFIRQTTMFGNDGLWHRINYCPNCGAKMDLEG